RSPSPTLFPYTTLFRSTPDPGQCAETTTMTISVNSTTIPTFSQVAPICAGDVLEPLPMVSAEGITGIWSPALNNMQTTTYTFIPDRKSTRLNSSHVKIS